MTWNAGTSLPVTLNNIHAVVTKNKVFIIGGFSSSWASTNKVYSADIDSEGVIGDWSDTGNDLPLVVDTHSIINTKTRVYVLGGATTNNVIYAPINEDGSLGSWVTDSKKLFVNTKYAVNAADVYNNRVYIVGLSNSTVCQYADIDSEGVIGDWYDANQNFGAMRAMHSTCIIKDKIYVFAGKASLTGGTPGTAEVFVSNIDESGNLGAWYSGNPLSQVTQGQSVVVTKNRIHIMGSFNGSASDKPRALMTAPIDSEGVVGTWSNLTDLPSNRESSGLVVTSSRLYLLGGVGTNTTIWTPFEGGANDYS